MKWTLCPRKPLLVAVIESVKIAECISGGKLEVIGGKKLREIGKPNMLRPILLVERQFELSGFGWQSASVSLLFLRGCELSK